MHKIRVYPPDQAGANILDEKIKKMWRYIGVLADAKGCSRVVSSRRFGETPVRSVVDSYCSSLGRSNDAVTRTLTCIVFVPYLNGVEKNTGNKNCIN
ncbi:hypothetical protein Q31b_56860 [Novipirellula aureliae]|uniref:Uncharacterized protein n=1 Tax=Novipirellula aureliae TaxID=2527966 RepID=A0A5C6DFA7_9BACT|nr:hypothetical protein Q31b_56860 [Novipirellula aureliae]